MFESRRDQPITYKKAGPSLRLSNQRAGCGSGGAELDAALDDLLFILWFSSHQHSNRETNMDGNSTAFHVQLYIYDLSKGIARQLSPIMLGKQLDGIWHTSIVVYGEEFFFGGVGISSCPPGGTMLGPPDSVVELGSTEVNEEIFMDYLSSLGESTYRGERYRLFEHNCNTFSNEVAQFLTGRKIPSYITDLPAEVLSTPFGQVLRPILDSIHIAPPGGSVINSQNNRS